jgi:hypothetical protein
MLCEYGCGKEATNVLKNGKHICGKGPSSCEVNKNLNSKAAKKTYKDGTRVPATQNFKDLPQETKDRMAWSRGKTIVPNDAIFVEYSDWAPSFVRKRIIDQELRPYKCEECDISEWQGKQIILDLDHKNGNNRDNRLENLRFLCPNCHSQTHTYKGKNINTGVKKVSDDELLAAFDEKGNIRKALIQVGLSAKGGNYIRVQRLLDRRR